MSNQLLDIIREEAPEMLDRLSEEEILSNIFDMFTNREQNRMLDLYIADWHGYRY